MSSKYYDTTAAMQTIGCVYNNPQLLENTDKYVITEEDFDNDFHKITFGSIYKVFELGANKVSLENIMDFLSSRPKSEGIFTAEKGDEWLLQASKSAIPNAFEYYYNRLKKMTLLRAYDKYGIDVTDIYDPDNIFDAKKKQLQEEYIDNTPIEKIADKVEAKIEAIRAQYVNDTFGEVMQAAEDIDTLFERLQEHPDVGVPLYGPLINTVTRGARLRKMYLRSAPSGYGKTRTMIADVCYMGCNEIYDNNFGWIRNGTAEPVLYITTEQEKDEVQTMMIAFLSNVNEDNILNSTFVGDELERVRKAIQVLKDSNIYIVELPDFSLVDVENIIKRNIRENGIKYVVFDYIMTSLKILEEISRRAGGVKIREDNILFMMSRRLKDIANEYGVFVLSGTQLNGKIK